MKLSQIFNILTQNPVKYKTICYLSEKSDQLTDSCLDEMLIKTLLKNNSQGITGVLVNVDKRFFQVIEGEESDINTLFNLIKSDKRHINIIQIFNERIDVKYFEKFSSSFRIALDRKDILTINKYLKETSEHPFSNRVVEILELLEFSARYN